jgi:hypothetical protein
MSPIALVTRNGNTIRSTAVARLIPTERPQIDMVGKPAESQCRIDRRKRDRVKPNEQTGSSQELAIAVLEEMSNRRASENVAILVVGVREATGLLVRETPVTVVPAPEQLTGVQLAAAVIGSVIVASRVGVDRVTPAPSAAVREDSAETVHGPAAHVALPALAVVVAEAGAVAAVADAGKRIQDRGGT